MINDFESSNMIEAYLRNELSPVEKAAFEKRIAQDPLLKNELELQKDIITTLQDHRKAELKHRLNQIDVSDGSNLSSYLRLFGLIGIPLLGFGLWMYLQRPASTTTAESGLTSATPGSSTTEKAIPAEKAPAETLSKATNPPPVSTPSKSESSPISQSEPIASEPIESSEPTGSKAIRPRSEKEPLQEEKRVNEPEANVKQSSSHLPDGVEEANDQIVDEKVSTPAGKAPGGLNITFDSQRYRFHYRNSHDKLTLYGDFSQGYKKVRYNDSLYLYFEGNFYHIRANQPDILPLTKITDEAKIESLRKLVPQE